MMSTFVDFEAIREQVSFATAIDLLKLKLTRSGNQFRGPCPVCNGDKGRDLVITEGSGHYCWGVRKGGKDVIGLAAHVLNLPPKEAGQELANRAGINVIPERYSTVKNSTVGTVPESEGGGGDKLPPLSYLENDHDAVVAVGFDPEFCKLHGIGYAPRGMMQGMIAIPFRDAHGSLIGYIGVEDCKIPPDFMTNVVSLAKRRA